MGAVFDYSRLLGGRGWRWFPGHMAKGISQIKFAIRERRVDILVEVRDSRIPLTSANPELDAIISRTGAWLQRIIVYNKTDMAHPKHLAEFRKRLDAESVICSTNVESDVVAAAVPPKVLFMCTKRRADMSRLFDEIEDAADARQKLLEQKFNIKTLESGVCAEGISAFDPSAHSTRVMVIGMPNVGKSTILNRLRHLGTGQHMRAVKVGRLPGITRLLSNRVRMHSDKPIYIVDTPGVLVPGEIKAETALKIAATGGIADLQVPEGQFILASYALHILNTTDLCFDRNPRDKKRDADPIPYYQYCGLPGPVQDFEREVLPGMAKKYRTLMAANGEINYVNATKHFINLFQEGRFGRFSLDL